MIDFSEFIINCGLSKIPFSDPTFTWTNVRVWARLDRTLVNHAWHHILKNTTLQHLNTNSDHSPLTISTNTEVAKYTP
ncbi:hypothetical protein KSP40_PGU019869 [Platanthera guangdongensis]|uniref:Uncharacterized protein n=1 Tax=Platanthera guangdongensis TaxID=2320717 RepID=A0ABR2LWE6_9ASPA